MGNQELVGKKFEELSMEEMEFVVGGSGNERITPTVTISIAASASLASSFVGSFTLSAFTNCRD